MIHQTEQESQRLYTGPTAEDLDKIPADLKACRQWILWRGADRIDRKTGEITGLKKLPIDPQTLHNADTTDPTTWGTFAQCVAALPVALEEWEEGNPSAYRGGGIGFVFTAEDPYTGIDLDHCIDPCTGIADGALDDMTALASYTETTPSGTGVHILVQGTLPPKGRKKGPVEMYNYARFFTMTGWHVPETPRTIESRQAELTAFHTAIFGVAQTTREHTDTVTLRLEDTALLDKARGARHGAGERFLTLWAGNTATYLSQSEADLGLCIRLAFWTQDAAQIDRLFRQSGLMRAKWDEKRGAQTYGARTITEALARQTEHYHPKAETYQHRNGDTPGPEPSDPSACPELPASAKVDTERAAEASIFLDDYIAFSKRWAPRAYEGFHEATGLFTLSTTAARRVKIAFGPHGVYTSLYLALAARTSLFTKTTAVDIALALLRLAGLHYLLADDDATPQAFLRSLTLYIPPDYDDLPHEAQDALRERLAFAGQKGWFYEEWGQHLHAMMQKEGQMAAFRSILRRLDDHQEQYTYSTIGRGRDVLVKPYVSLLANVTPADLKPFIKAQSPLWRDGYIARFAFVAPGDAPTSIAPFPEGEMRFPRPLITTLASWHKRLGIPRVTLDPILDQKDKATGRYQPVFTQAHHETTYQLSPDVRKAFYAYDEALHTLMAQSKNEDLDGSYARFPMKALRIAGLLASLHDDSGKYTIWPAQWYRGQQIAERWRQSLHTLIGQVQEATEPTATRQLEEGLIRQVKKHGPQTLTELARFHKTRSVQELRISADGLVAATIFTVVNGARQTKYALTATQGREP